MAEDQSSPLTRNQGIVPDDYARLHSLLEKVCDQSVDAAEAHELDALLALEKSVREYYLRYISLHSSLQNGAVGISESSADECSDCMADINRSRRTLRRKIVGVLALAATLAAVLLGVTRYRSSSGGSMPPQLVKVQQSVPSVLPVARVTQLSDDIVWQSPNESIALHSHVSAGHVLQLTRGEMRLTYGSGVELRLLGPAEFVVGPAGGRLVRGGVRAVVPEKGRGFTIETPNGKVVDLGTEFGVAVDDFGVSEVNVFQGMVDAFPAMRSGSAESVRLKKGEAVQWNSETLVHLSADAVPFGGAVPAGKGFEAGQPMLDENFKTRGLDTSDWRTLGDVKVAERSLQLCNSGDPTKIPYLITAHEFAPTNGPITVVADIRFTDVAAPSVPAFAILTRSASDRNPKAAENRRTMYTCVRCSFKSAPDLSSSAIEVATKLDPNCPLTNNLWRGFDHLEENLPYRLVMTDDGINVTFTVSLRDDPSVNKTVTCRSLFRGKENFIVFEGSVDGTVAVDRIQLFQDTSAKTIARSDANRSASEQDSVAKKELVAHWLAEMAPSDAKLIVSDDFDGDVLNENLWATLDDVTPIGGRVRLGKPNSLEHINTLKSRPYLLTREQFTPADGAITVMGTAEFENNFLNEYGGSFAVMTRADDARGNGPTWEYSTLTRGIRANFWPAAWGQQHSLEIHEKPTPTSLSLLVAEGLEINPEAREYFFKIVDDGQLVTLKIQDTRNPAISKTVSVRTSPVLKSGLIGFEGCWGCPVWLDNVRIYQTPRTQ